MDKFIKTIIIILCFSSFKSDKADCRKDLFLGVNIRNSVKIIHKKLDSDTLFAPRPVATLLSEDSLKSYSYRYLGPNLPIYNDYDSIVFYFCETVGTDGTKEGHGIKLKLIDVNIYYSDSNKLNNNYRYVKDNLCKNLKFNTAVVYKYPIIELEKHIKTNNLYHPHPCYFLDVMYVDKL